MFLPELLKQLSHIEQSDIPTEDGGKITKMIIDSKFPDINQIELKINEKSISLNFPHFGMNLQSDMVDAQGNPM